ncbi:MAG: inorganic pyrophosphatase [Actinomycetota bacterium]
MLNRFDSYRAHPWHGLPIGTDPPSVVDAYIEITPFDAVKYEIDKRTGYLRVDRPQGSSALPPTLYGFIPQTYCHDQVAALTPGAAEGDRDPLDICVLSQQRIDRAEIVVPARVVGGVQVLDGGEADDKIVAVLASDTVFDYAKELGHLPVSVVNRIVHYFATYKMDITGEVPNAIEVVGTYGADHARSVVSAAIADYREAVGDRRRPDPERSED